MKQKLVFLNFFFLLSVTSLYAQSTRKITGTVKDETGIALPGATVQIKATQKGTSTDLIGFFEIEVENSDILIFSFIGYNTLERMVGSNSTIEVSLSPETSSLEEVVITALGITKAEKKIGYATQSIDANKVQEVAAPNVGSLLTGQVSGLQVSNPTGLMQAPSFSLRGKTPLIVIDGIPVSTDFFDISAEDIADINVLKGTSASVLYGSRGRNGAVLITTKNAKKEGIEVSVSQNTMFSAGFTIYPKTQTEYGNGSNGQY
jgi:TonB-dependent SusC/RagA subfamily outer membrane receptor